MTTTSNDGMAIALEKILSHELASVPAPLRVLDFGCGKGALVAALNNLGCDAYGCDLGDDWEMPDGEWKREFLEDTWADRSRLHKIQQSPYRLPFPDNTFDAVVSNQVLEHVQDKEAALSEIVRVLKPRGIGVHVLPSKWFLPTEPHIFVPFASWMWPNVPRWWLAFCAMAGIRNEFQTGKDWREVAAVNFAFCRDGICYWSKRRLHDLLLKTSGDFHDYTRLRHRLLGGNPRVAFLAEMKSNFAQLWIGHRKLV